MSNKKRWFSLYLAIFLAACSFAQLISPGSVWADSEENKDSTALDKTGWTASATYSSTWSEEFPVKALDGNPESRWSSGKPAAKGVYFQVDMLQVRNFDRITLDASKSCCGDYPNTYDILVSNDGTTWGDPIYSGTGSKIIDASFPLQTARYIRVVKTSDDGAWWAIWELNVYRPMDTSPPSAPADLEAQEIKDRAVTLQWKASEDDLAGIVRYDVYGATVTEDTYGTPEKMGSAVGTETSLPVTGLTPQTTYRFTVKAVDADNNVSDESNPIDVTTKEMDPWTMVWHDEFDGKELDRTKWDIADWKADYNNEMEYYTPEDVYLQDGNLVIRTQKREFGGMHYSSGRIHSDGKFQFNYGKIEFRAKVPTGQGIWPTHWLANQISWPPEMDVMEMIGQEPNRNYMTYHYGVYPNNAYTSDQWDADVDLSKDFHVYGMEWEPGVLRWYVDGVLRRTYENVNVTDQDMFIIINTAVGGFAGAPDATTVFPQYHLVDYVRVYTKTNGAVDKEPPGPPQTPSAEAQDNELRLTWKPGTDDTGVYAYDVYQDDKFLGTTTASFYLMRNLPANTTYHLKIRSRDAFGNVSEFVPFTVKTLELDTESPTAPTHLTSTSATDTSVGLQWEASTDNRGVTQYAIYNSSTEIARVDGSVLKYTVSNLLPDRQYTFTVRALDRRGNLSEASDVLKVSTQAFAGTKLSYTAKAPVIDGKLDETWNDQGSEKLGKVIMGQDNISSPDDLSASYRAMWDDQNLYVFADVKDSVKLANSDAVWRDDSVEVYIDANNDKAASYDDNDYQYSFRWNDKKVYESKHPDRSITGVTFAQGDTDSGYQMEIKIPWSTLGGSPGSGVYMGFDVQVNDNDGYNGRETKIAWNAEKDNAFTDPRAFGTVQLTVPQGGGDGNPPTAPTGFRVTSKDDTSIQLAWNASADDTKVAGYVVYSGKDQLAFTSGTSFKVTDLTPDTSYNFSVKARDFYGNLSENGPSLTVSTALIQTLPRDNWTATASSSWPDSPPANAIDASKTTRWATGAGQTNGQWFQLDLGKSQTFNRIVLDDGLTNGDYPRGYQVYVSEDGSNWGDPVASGQGSQNNGTAILLSGEQTARYVKIVQIGNAGGTWWGIYDIKLQRFSSTDAQAPSAPEHLRVKSATRTTATVQWDASGDDVGVTGYVLYNANTDQKIGEVDGTTTTFTLSELTPDSTLSIYVKAKDASGKMSEASNKVEIHTSDKSILLSETAFSNLEGKPIKRLNPGERVKITTTLNNNTEDALDAWLAVALKTPDGVIRNKYYVQTKLKLGESQSVTTALTLPSNTAGNYIELFAVSNPETDTIISESVRFPKMAISTADIEGLLQDAKSSEKLSKKLYDKLSEDLSKAVQELSRGRKDKALDNMNAFIRDVEHANDRDIDQLIRLELKDAAQALITAWKRS
ncbi:beta-glucanase (GH16 family) [Paenibacillus rhizosphaerae]|uniref:Beta-glucanase (GH16 family) n=1 Tax=Paenibacillus rhizosphaerae TaxID=297318 RepID=A0A839TJT1_9BACL|nr:sugar-binding protein [Paenibacillus rhizosphaerae]MBB3127046.1 beta-glucanase (GH16 family) [Paenibacillus rhizosphaerae]